MANGADKKQVSSGVQVLNPATQVHPGRAGRKGPSGCKRRDRVGLKGGVSRWERAKVANLYPGTAVKQSPARTSVSDAAKWPRATTSGKHISHGLRTTHLSHKKKQNIASGSTRTTLQRHSTERAGGFPRDNRPLLPRASKVTARSWRL